MSNSTVSEINLPLSEPISLRLTSCPLPMVLGPWELHVPKTMSVDLMVKTTSTLDAPMVDADVVLIFRD